MTEGKTKIRMTVLAALIAFMFAALSTRLWFLQVLATQEFSQRAQTNRVRIVPEEAPRGRILDRNGRVLVSNRPVTIVTIDRTALPKNDQESVLLRLSQLLKEPVETLVQRMGDVRYLPYQPVPVAFGVERPAAFYISEHPDLFPGVGVDTIAARSYPRGGVAAHILGYTGEISAEDLKSAAFAGYPQGIQVGKTGVERTYEVALRGKEGLVKYEVNSKGEVLQPLGEQPPVPGDDLVLSIDSKIQTLAEQSLSLGISLANNTYDSQSGKYLQAGAGAAIVMDPSSGRVLALASLPTFDPQVFLGGLSEKEFKRLNKPKRNYPLLDRALQATYPAGSTFKPITAAAAMKTGIASPNGFYPCPAEYAYPGDTSGTVFHNWRSSDAGSISLAESLIQSCDTVYYRFGAQFYGERLIHGEVFQQQLRKWGFGRATRIDLPSEGSGRVPDKVWKETASKHNPFIRPKKWVPGDDINMSIGQGNLEVTPLQIATAYSAIANGGTLYAPRVALKTQRPDGTGVRKIKPLVIGHVPSTPAQLRFLREALTGVPRTGTASGAFAGFPLSRIPVAGKTGTAEVKPKQPDSWFAAMVPADHPQYVVVAIVEQGGHGAQTAAPVVRRIIEGLFGLGTDAVLQAGQSVD